MNELQKHQLLKAKNHAISKGGECLSTEYANQETKLEWKCCNDKHDLWISSYCNVVIRGNWCPKCAIESSRDQNGLFKYKEYAKSKGGMCLANEYTNSRVKVEWKCDNLEHPIFEASSKIIRDGGWCPKCSYEKISQKLKFKDGLNRAKEYAKSRGGECLSTEYVNCREKLKWKCNNQSHDIWEGGYSSVVARKTWCIQCGFESAYNKNKNLNGLQIAQEYAKSRGGECLSTEYVNSKQKLEWKCANKGHKSWFALFHIIRDNNWCPNCAKFYYKEHKVRKLLEYIFDAKFEKARPKWNINPQTNKLLELDGYNKELGIAFEFQGLQHYEANIFASENLEYRKYKDEIKKKNCFKNNVKLIVIDDIFNLKQNNFIVKYIMDLLKEKKIFIQKEIQKIEVDKIMKDVIYYDKDRILLAQEYAKSKGGMCLSKIYINHKIKLNWKCHVPSHAIWSSNYGTVVSRSSWCPECATDALKYKLKNKNGLELSKKHAENKGGQCLSVEYINSYSKLKWKCDNPDHNIWESPYRSVVLNNNWCPECAKDNKKKKK